jgi:hypothetical protein
MKSFFAEVEVPTDGEPLRLVCNFLAIDCIESLAGEKMQDILPQLADPPQSLAVKVLWGLLRHRHEGITLDEAAAIAFGPDKGKVALAMGEAISRAFSFEEAKDANPPERRGRSRSSEKSG